MRRPDTRAYFALLLALATFLAVVTRLARVPWLEIEEHFALGQRFRATGSLESLLRPPGYPAFVALTLSVRDGLAAIGALGADLAGDAATVIGVQRAMLALGSLGLFVAMRRESTPFGAFCVGALACANPLFMVLASTLSYVLLDAVLISLGTIAMTAASRDPASSPRRALLAGAVWGLAALVRPVALILPLFVPLLPRLKGERAWGPGLRLAGWVALGMALVVCPYMLRNFARTGRLVPVSAQAGFNLWAVSAARPGPGQTHISWTEVWNRDGMPVYSRVTGAPQYDLQILTAQVLPLNEEFGRLALANIRRHPATYLLNVANNLYRFNVDTSSWWWRRFLWQQVGRAGAYPLPPRPARAAAVADGFVAAVSVAGAVGLVLGWRRRDPRAAPIAVVYAALWIGNSIMILVPRYTYVKLPLLVMALGMLFPRGAEAGRLATVTACLLVLAGLGGCLTLIFTY